MNISVSCVMFCWFFIYFSMKEKKNEKQNQLQPVLPNLILLFLPGFSSPSTRILMISVSFSKDFSIEEASVNNVCCVEEFVIKNK